ncbi:nuclear transport factor 2 family protein [Pseudonocardia kujensis]|uniref:nuclear transport factor 2 family protein n=1 Tax=Pseudonocardia kujensis TaxID=1128675 RepID=UPI001E2DACFC|nr:nuclear transport factor 2 family protein [Pseudonocardia kujensis]MCE0761986.1 nuclear transport factor 2 family protein [Pseudonocardia kujensis]
MSDNDVTALAEAYIEAYNSGDLDRIAATLAEDVEITHHNRGAHAKDKAAAMEMFTGAGQVMPDKHFEGRINLQVTGPDSVVVRHVFVANPKVDIPGFGPAGEEIRLELATFLRFADGLLVEYNDFG